MGIQSKTCLRTYSEETFLTTRSSFCSFAGALLQFNGFAEREDVVAPKEILWKGTSPSIKDPHQAALHHLPAINPSQSQSRMHPMLPWTSTRILTPVILMMTPFSKVRSCILVCFSLQTSYPI